jgi:hypothetical protein
MFENQRYASVVDITELLWLRIQESRSKINNTPGIIKLLPIYFSYTAVLCVREPEHFLQERKRKI